MNVAVWSIIALIAAIVIGFFRKSNVGIICIGFAMILAIVSGLGSSVVLSGFSSSLCVQMIGITYLFAIINGNGTLSVVANKTIRLVGKHTFLIPFVIFALGYALCAVGPGAIPTLAIIPVLAVPVAMKAGINPIMLSLIGQMGVQSARMSQITPEAIVVQELMDAQGIVGNTTSIGWCMLVTEILLVAVVYVYYKGWRCKPVAFSQDELAQKLTKDQILSLFGLLVLIVGVLFFGWNSGLTGFMVGTILVILGYDKEKESIKSIPWNVILMVLGVGMLMNIITTSGGIDILVATFETVMTPSSAAAIMSLVAGIMSFFSSGLGVVFPTLIPTAGGLASSLGVNALELVAVIVVGGTVTGFSPISTAGALIMAAVSQDGEEGVYNQNRMFVELFAVAFIALFILMALAFCGVYGLICS